MVCGRIACESASTKKLVCPFKILGQLNVFNSLAHASNLFGNTPLPGAFGEKIRACFFLSLFLSV